MRYPTAYGAAEAWPPDIGRDNRNRNEPLLPGTSMATAEPLPRAYIYQPAPRPTQYGRARSKEWIIEFVPSYPTEIDPLMGWTSSRDPFSHIRLRFPDQESAIAFAERQGWPYEVRDPPVRRFEPKSYADNFRYDLANAVARAQRASDGKFSTANADLPAR